MTNYKPIKFISETVEVLFDKPPLLKKKPNAAQWVLGDSIFESKWKMNGFSICITTGRSKAWINARGPGLYIRNWLNFL